MSTTRWRIASMPRPRKMLALLLAAAALSGCATTAGERPAPAPAAEAETAGASSDPVTMSFVFVGCNRVGWSEKDGVPLPASTANEPQLLQTFKDVQALAASRGHAPDYLFLLGDVVRNETDGATLTTQLDLWQQLWDSGALAGSSTRLVPITGNHEVLKSVEYAENEFYEVPDASSNAAWLAWLNKNQHPPQPGNGPTPSSEPQDLLRADNSQLTYSFDAKTSDGKSVHFLLLDTDTDSTFTTTDASCYQPPQQDATYDGQTVEGTMSQDVPGWIPLEWVKQDLAGASGSDYVFAFGHKPIVFPASAGPATASTGRDSVFNCGDQMLAQELFAAFQGTGGFVAYLTAHKHLYDASQIPGSGASLWQIIAGDGGSPLEKGVPKQFGFTLVEVFASGKVTATPFVRPEPSPYYGTQGVVPAQPGTVVTLKGS